MFSRGIPRTKSSKSPLRQTSTTSPKERGRSSKGCLPRKVCRWHAGVSSDREGRGDELVMLTTCRASTAPQMAYISGGIYSRGGGADGPAAETTAETGDRVLGGITWDGRGDAVRDQGRPASGLTYKRLTWQWRLWGWERRIVG